MSSPQQPLVEAARRGDEGAFRRLLDPLRGELYGHCYRMLTSVHDAEDAMQDVMLRAWRALATYEGRAPVHSWLHRIATNVCLDAIRQRRSRAVPLDPASAADRHCDAAIQPSPRHGQDGEPAGAHVGAAGLDTDYEHREAAALAFGHALHLPAKQRAVLILREVLGFSAAETASSLDTTVPAVNSALQRARANLDEGEPHALEQRFAQAHAGSNLMLQGRRLLDERGHGLVEDVRLLEVPEVGGAGDDPQLGGRYPRRELPGEGDIGAVV